MAELKRRKQEAEKAASSGTEKQESTAPAGVAGKPVEDQRPGELQHVREFFVACVYFERLMPSSDFWYPSGSHVIS